MTENLKQQVAERLRTARGLAGLSQGQVAKLLSLNHPTISEAEAGRRDVSAQELARFADLYAVSTAWLMCNESEHDSEEPRMRFAAREIAKLKSEDAEKLLKLVKALRSRQEPLP